MSEELKPCPLCRKPGRVAMSNLDYVICPDLECPMPPMQGLDWQWPRTPDSLIAVLVEALRSLVDKLDIILPLVDNAIVLETLHGRPYTGPTIGEELDAARAALAETRRQYLQGGKS